MSLTHVVHIKMVVNAFFFFMTSLNPNKHAFRAIDCAVVVVVIIINLLDV